MIHAERFRSGAIHLRRYTNGIPLPFFTFMQDDASAVKGLSGDEVIDDLTCPRCCRSPSWSCHETCCPIFVASSSILNSAFCSCSTAVPRRQRSPGLQVCEEYITKLYSQTASAACLMVMSMARQNSTGASMQPCLTSDVP